jgi:hypothetical protein
MLNNKIYCIDSIFRLVCNDFVVGRVVEKNVYGVAGGYFANDIIRSSVKYYRHKNVTEICG